MGQSQSQLVPRFLLTISLLFTSATLFCFVNQFICNLFKKYSTYKRYHMIFVFLSDLTRSVWTQRTLALTLGVMLAQGRV